MSLEGRGEFSEENKKGYASCRTAGVRERKCVETVLQFSPPSNNLIERIQKLFFFHFLPRCYFYPSSNNARKRQSMQVDV
jgi:hypothetical protein